MRPETIGDVAYFSLSVDAPNKLRGLTSSQQQQVEIALPGGGSVTCTLRSQAQPGGIMLLIGGCLLMLIGFVWMRKVVRLDV